MKDINNFVDMLVADIDEIPEDVHGTYVVWAVGYDEEGNATGASMLLNSFRDPDMAVAYAKALDLAAVVHLAADDDCDCEVTTGAHSISIEIEAVVNDEEGCAMGTGVVYKRSLEIYEELPEFIPLSEDDYVLLADGDIMVPKNLLADYNIGDDFTAVFNDNGISEPMIYKIKSAVGEVCVCEFV